MVDITRTPSLQHAVALIADSVDGTVRNFERLEAAKIDISLDPGRRLFKPLMEGLDLEWAVRQCELEREKNIKPNIGLVKAFAPCRRSGWLGCRLWRNDWPSTPVAPVQARPGLAIRQAAAFPPSPTAPPVRPRLAMGPDEGTVSVAEPAAGSATSLASWFGSRGRLGSCSLGFHIALRTGPSLFAWKRGVEALKAFADRRLSVGPAHKGIVVLRNLNGSFSSAFRALDIVRKMLAGHADTMPTECGAG